jgi:hypothetical protein
MRIFQTPASGASTRISITNGQQTGKEKCFTQNQMVTRKLWGREVAAAARSRNDSRTRLAEGISNRTLKYRIERIWLASLRNRFDATDSGGHRESMVSIIRTIFEAHFVYSHVGIRNLCKIPLKDRSSRLHNVLTSHCSRDR